MMDFLNLLLYIIFVLQICFFVYMLFSKHYDNTRTKTYNSDDYERTNKRITDLAAKLELLETKFALFKTDYENLRGKFNRKLSGLAAEETKEKTQDFNSRDEIYMG